MLRRVLDERKGEERIPVAVWLRLPAEDLPEKSPKRATAKPPRSETEQAQRIAALAERVQEVLREHGAVDPRPDPHAPVVFAELPANRIRRLEKHDDVAALFLHDARGEVDLSDSMKIAQMPKVESIIMPSGGFWGGVGEPTICVAAPAVLNAMARATGKRIRTFPLKNHGYQLG